uniref:G-protein coupled receptors family 3 profile domain-containing protein n=1 Tax=Mucochytrium quahogii TaxID=96639 RepID=A0A7S2RLL1_9STRA|mmetsp:Transcript_16910/g.36792  ORF Transcript_16910/g.36792 Transcript_16910/m.36792 type:complete len:323 (+) Transcript_16910:336-1304(+)|eukprot:CAMPEP_0203762538 /NCGR_PEP_ID=MMETSP0098-20131031/15398_1 /ASSEMBLY_ACC=CAM_ASM_000208 /TAXON_ID=96639 /ORGANISM=" , Strain NY0313808BC1" /LENGTH=322 /DNA_ID=CAMNT_0050656983 /DNA_START=59 /DNA_END=1027 /DNA_ORIENTATION=+
MTLKDSYESLAEAVSIICFTYALLSLVVIWRGWNKHIMILSQRSFMLGIAITLIVANAGSLAGCDTHIRGLFHAMFFYVGMTTYFAILTAKEFRCYYLWKAITTNGETNYSSKASTYGPWIFVGVSFLIIFLQVLIQEIPSIKYGFKPCGNSATESKRISETYNIPDTGKFYFFIANHIFAFLMAVLARRVPSICGDAKTILVVSFLGVVYVALKMISHRHDLTNDTKTRYRIAYTCIDLAIQVISLTGLIFSRLVHWNMRKEDIVKVFLKTEFRQYEAATGSWCEEVSFVKHADDDSSKFGSSTRKREFAPSTVTCEMSNV